MSQFRTLKYCPQFPDRFGSIEDGRAFGQEFFRWYNQDHRHSGLGFLTPAVVHVGQADVVRAHRARVLAAAYAAHPERFLNGRPHPADLPTAVWISPPVKKPTGQDAQKRRSSGRTTRSMVGFSRPHGDRPPC
jgi:putative transposase